ncbi:MAG: hypothetical protein LBJ02_08190 [Bifidobacteriaceae bacterium]|jgi:hypothetical protein|nr:hypothetical protein [Bifidobacteriaceae bacterium]
MKAEEMNDASLGAVTNQADLTRSAASRVPRTAWAALLLLVAISAVARMGPVKREVERELAAGNSPFDPSYLGPEVSTDLAVMIGIVGALVVTIGVRVLMVATAMLLDRRFAGAGWLRVGRRRFSLTYLIAAGTVLGAEAMAFARPGAGVVMGLDVGLCAFVVLGSAILARGSPSWRLWQRLGYSAVVGSFFTFVF